VLVAEATVEDVLNVIVPVSPLISTEPKPNAVEVSPASIVPFAFASTKIRVLVTSAVAMPLTEESWITSVVEAASPVGKIWNAKSSLSDAVLVAVNWLVS